MKIKIQKVKNHVSKHRVKYAVIVAVSVTYYVTKRSNDNAERFEQMLDMVWAHVDLENLNANYMVEKALRGFRFSRENYTHYSETTMKGIYV